MTRYVCEPLGDHHDRQSFRCGVDALDEYLRRRASQDMRRRVAAVFVMVPADEPHRIAGFYTLSSAAVRLDELPAELAKKLPRYPMVPAALIGRLARDVNFPGVGKLLLLDALARLLRHSEEVATTVVLVYVKDEAARRFYARYGFREVLRSPQRMFLPVKTVEILLHGS